MARISINQDVPLGTSCTFSVKSLDNSSAPFRAKPGCRVIGTVFTMDTVEERQIRAVFDDKTIRVHQAYSHEIADSALKHGTFVSPPFSMNRMTWIKPSFLWMMYRSGWATKPGRERILAIDITHVGFEWAIDHAILPTYNPELHKSQNIWQAQLQSAPVRL